MLKVGLLGLGFMGRGHFEQYMRLMSEGAPVKLVALCDVDPKKFEATAQQAGNIGDLGKASYDFSSFRTYTDFRDMIANEQLDYIDSALPTYLHSYYTCRAMEAGLHVLSEKPMALNPAQCDMMVGTAKRTGKTLMIGQCLRFWPAYETLKEYIAGGKLGAPVCAYFYRGGGIPMLSYQDWVQDVNRSGGCLLDQHVHDIDMINYLFGMPEAVSSQGRNFYPGAGYDAVSTHYRFPGDFVVTAEDDWSQHGVPFSMMFRVNLERGTMIFDRGVLTVYTEDAEPFVPEDCGDMGYYREIKYFIDCVGSGKPVSVCTPESTRDSIRIAAAESESADKRGEWVAL